MVLGLFRGKVHIVVEPEHLLRKRRIVRQHAGRVFINMNSVCHGFHRNGLVFVCDDPVQLRRRHLRMERRVQEIEPLDKRSCLGCVGALAENPWDKFVLCHIVRIIRSPGSIAGVSHKVQPCHTKSFFVDGIVKKRISIGDVCCSDDCIVLF